MSKKRPESKNAHDVKLKVVPEIEKYFRAGNFYQVRRDAKLLLATPTTAPDVKSYARRALIVTWPDSHALFAGFAALVFTLAIAFFASY